MLCSFIFTFNGTFLWLRWFHVKVCASLTFNGRWIWGGGGWAVTTLHTCDFNCCTSKCSWKTQDMILKAINKMILFHEFCMLYSMFCYTVCSVTIVIKFLRKRLSYNLKLHMSISWQEVHFGNLRGDERQWRVGLCSLQWREGWWYRRVYFL